MPELPKSYVDALQEIEELKDKINRATLVLQNAPDDIIDTRSNIRAVLQANKVAWAILTEDKYPPSQKGTYYGPG